MLKSSGGVKIKPLKLVNGIAAYLAPQAEKALLMRGEVLRIDDDIILEAVEQQFEKKRKPEPTQPPLPDSKAQILLISFLKNF